MRYRGQLSQLKEIPPPSRFPQFPPVQIQFPIDTDVPDLADAASSTSALNTLLVDEASLVEDAEVDTDVRPTALVTLFKLSTVSIAGPRLKKSTRI